MGASPAAYRGSVLTVYVLGPTVLIGYLRGMPLIASALRRRLSDGHTLATTCVNLAEVERGLQQRERRRAAAFLVGLRFYRPTGRRPDGPVATDWAKRGRTIYTADALLPAPPGPTAPSC